MPSFDISRVAFDSRKHYKSVRMQQGRVLTDDDWNENERIGNEDTRRTKLDIIGKYGSPDQGFKIKILSGGVFPDGLVDFEIHKGTIYLGGLRLEMDETETFRLQRDWLEKVDADDPVPAPQDKEIYDLVYLEAWQQAISAVEDSSLFEVALGGPDTTTRMRNMRRVRLFRKACSPECAISWKNLVTNWHNAHLGTLNEEMELTSDAILTVSFVDGSPDDLCSPPVAGGYLGAENQAIRVQIRDFNANTKSGHFTWGFDNAAPLYRVKVLRNKIVTMETLPKDQYHWPLSGQTVEFLPWSAVLPNNEKLAEQIGELRKVAISYNPDNKTFEINSALPANYGMEWKNRSDAADLVTPDDHVYLYMRIWNRGSDLRSPENIPFTIGNPVKLGNTGLQVSFTGTELVGPDEEDNKFWVIAARPASPKVMIPWDFKTGRSWNGTRVFYAPLAIIRWKLVGNGMVAEVIHDCRKHFHPLTDDDCCCTFTVGDGVTSHGDFDDIQEAIDSLPGDGGKICVLRGIHQASAVINLKKQIQISGCGEQSIIRPAENKNNPIFLIRNSQRIKIDNLTLVSFNGIGIDVEDLGPRIPPSGEIVIRENRILAFIHAIRVNLTENRKDGNRVRIAFNQIGMYDKQGGNVAIFSLADDVVIERNRIVLIPPPKEPTDPGGPGGPGGPFDPCADDKKLYGGFTKLKGTVNAALNYIAGYVALGVFQSNQTLGGIQIGCGSEKVWILQNEIIGGMGNGITLGHLRTITTDNRKIPFLPTLYDINIEENEITEMGLSGIGTFFHPDQTKDNAFIHIENLLISKNIIQFCVQALRLKETVWPLSLELPPSGISLAFVEDAIIHENWIESNGKNQSIPVCGIFVFFAEKIDISENRIIDNGPDTQEKPLSNKQVKAGIVIWFAAKLPEIKQPYNSGTLSGVKNAKAIFPVFDAVPAAKIQDNIVSQPLGLALFLIAFGPVSVVSNQFDSQGINHNEFYSRRAGAVYLYNLGISKDILNIYLLPLKHWGHVNPSALLALLGSANPATSTLFLLLQLLPNGKTLFNSNQTTLDMRSIEIDVCISSQLIFTLDDLSFIGNQLECAGFASLLPKPNPPITMDIVFFNTLLFSISTRCSDNRFTDGFSFTFYSLLSLALMNTAIGNQSTHCLIVPFWFFRRKGQNIQLNVLDCQADLLEKLLTKNNIHTADPRFNFETY